MKLFGNLFDTFVASINSKSPLALIILVIAIFCVFRLIRFFKKRFVTNQHTKDSLKKFLPTIELLSWVVFGIWAIFNFIIEGESKKETGNQVFLVLLIVLVIIVAWLVLHDFIAGLIIRLEGIFEVGDRVRTKGLTGIVRNMSYRSMQLETDQGELVTVPYSKLTNEVNAKSQQDGTSVSGQFRFEVSNENGWTETAKQLKKLLLNTPWSLVNRKPTLSLIEEREKTFLIDCTVYVLDHEHLPKLKNYLNKQQLISIPPTRK